LETFEKPIAETTKMNDEERKELPEKSEGDGTEQAPPANDEEQTETTEQRPRRLHRSRSDKVLGGVGGGLGSYFGVDPIFFRIGFVALTFFGGAGIFLYLAAWIFVPPEGSARAFDPRLRGRALTVIGAVVLAIAALSVLGSFGDHGWGWGWGWWWGAFLGPLALIALGGALLWAYLSERRGDGDGIDAGWVVSRIALVIAVLAGSTVLFFGSALVAAAGGGAAVASLVVVIGALLAVAAFRGGARWLILPALLLAIPAGVVSAADVDLDGGVGEKEYRPASLADLRPGYELGMGRLEVDLRDLDLPAGDRPLRIDLGIGQAVVIVPEDVCVTLDSRVGAGYARLFDRDSGGLDLDWDSSPTAHPAVSRLLLDADVGIGALEVVHDPADVNERDGRWGREWGPGDTVEDSLGNVGCERRPAQRRRERNATP
jgi:phage shock protein PspC (stress-responsive transcriptional regulator)/predicted membrane protein